MIVNINQIKSAVRTNYLISLMTYSTESQSFKYGTNSTGECLQDALKLQNQFLSYIPRVYHALLKGVSG